MSSAFIHQSTPFGPLFTSLIFFELFSEFPELFEFEIRTARWATAEDHFFLADTGI